MLMFGVGGGLMGRLGEDHTKETELPISHKVCRAPSLVTLEAAANSHLGRRALPGARSGC